MPIMPAARAATLHQTQKVAAAAAPGRMMRRLRALVVFAFASFIVFQQAVVFYHAHSAQEQQQQPLSDEEAPPPDEDRGLSSSWSLGRYCSTTKVTWTERPLKPFLPLVNLTDLASPFEPTVDIDKVAGPYPSRNHFNTCGAKFKDPIPPGRGYRPGQAKKFFHEGYREGHRDSRFGPAKYKKNRRPHPRYNPNAPAPPPPPNQPAPAAGPPPPSVSESLADLIGAWSRFTASAGITSWLAHGTLLGWYWAGVPLPWDDDIDLQMTLRDLDTLAASYDRTSFENRYLIEVNPHRTNRWRDLFNIIDARFIDTVSGRFLDITALASSADPNVAAELKDGERGLKLWCKSQHIYDFVELFPLRRSTFEGADVWVPFDVKAVLVSEYGNKSISLTEFHGHKYDASKKRWEPVPGVAPKQ
ncbi:LicD family-domain-containing protein [Zopfochytrium polystomum]|nr:LicD family-domain-containing protein [Zopfochytrium polystomum]